MSKRECYVQLFGDFGATLSDADWIDLANDSLPPNLSALNARIVAGSRADRFLQVAYRPGPESFTFISLSGGCVAEMLDQAAAHCGTFVTSYGCPTLTMTANYLHAGIGSAFVATIPGYYTAPPGTPNVLRTLGVVKDGMPDDGLHDSPGITLNMLLTDPSSVRWDARVKAKKAAINGVDISNLNRSREWGRAIVDARANRTVTLIKQAIAEKKPS